MNGSYLIIFVELLFNILSLAILFRVLLSWVDPSGNMRVSQILHELTEPILGPIRRVLPSAGMFDFSPIVAALLLKALGEILVRALSGTL